MKRQPINSSDLVSVGYDVKNEILEIEFHQGRVYQYFDVPVKVYAELMNAEDNTKYFEQNIKEINDVQRMDKDGSADSKNQ